METGKVTITINLPTIADLDRLTKALTSVIKPPATIGLVGDLGAGKTAFVQSLARAYGVYHGVVSPTFTLANHYALSDELTLIHGDLYRLGDTAEFHELGLSDYYDDSRAIVALEWADRFASLLPAATLWINLEAVDDQRVCRINGLTSSHFLQLEPLLI